MKKSFTLVELMIVIAILAILSAIVIFTLNPSRLFDNFRDTRRVSDIQSINKAIVFMESWNANGVNYGNNMTVYLSLPDASSTCSSYALPTLATGYTYSCKPTSTFKNTDSTGWIPIDFTVSNSNRYITTLPVDPINDSTYFYSYFPGGSYELIARLKNSRSNSINDNGFYDDAYELGSPNRTNYTPVPKNLILNGEMESLTNWSGFSSVETNDFYEGSASLRSDRYTTIFSSAYLKVDTTKRYRLSGCFKSVGVGGLTRAYFGYEAWDKNKRQFSCYMADHFIDRKTELAQNLNPGDTVVYLNSVANYTLNNGKYLGFYPFEDYPDYTYTRNIITYTSINTENNSLVLTTPYAGVAFPAGTKVTQQAQNTCGYMYSVFTYTLIPNQWTCYSSEIFGEYVPAVNFKQFRYGTYYFRALMLLNYDQSTGYSVLVDNVKLELISNQ